MMIDIPLLKWLLVTVNWTIFALLFMLMCEHFYAGNKLSVGIVFGFMNV